MISAEEFLAVRGVTPTRDAPSVLAARHEDGEDEASEPEGRGWGRGRGGFGGRRPAQPVDDPDDLDACREAALRLLDAAPRASGALRDRLLDKGYAEDVVDDVIERLTRVQLLDDRAYAESAVRHCVERLMGRRAAVVELTRKGVERALAEQVAAEAEERGVFEDAAWELGRQVARKTRGLDREVRRRRLWSAGGRKGHSPDVLRRVAQELLV